MAQAVRENTEVTYKISDIRAGKRVLNYFQTKILKARAAGFELEFSGEGTGEIGVDRKTGKTIMRINPKFYRPAEVDLLIGRPAKALQTLHWQPQTTLEQLCDMMVRADIRRNEAGTSF